MALSNRERVGKALDLLCAGLAPFVERELKATHGDKWEEVGREGQPPERNQKLCEVAVQRHRVALEQEGRDHGNDVQTEVPAAPNSVFRMND